ncbi:energy transducer TonB [Maribellus sediminis]|uniref:energy transducer TonB n=1 Tax=Maribellus sediminis TaxID=2696285 RepID=UPI0014300ABC|nr:energy transducer TonB [Maribellus sediminis]
MKKSVIFFICFVVPFFLFGQNKTEDPIANVGEVQVSPPQFTGINNVNNLLNESSDVLIKAYLAEKITFPERAAVCKQEGTEVIKFLITPEGEVSDITIVNSVCPELDKEIVRVLQTTNGMWKPGLRNNNAATMPQEISMVYSSVDEANGAVMERFYEKAKYFLDKGNQKLYVKEKPSSALKFYNNGIKYLPNDESLLMARGLCLYALGDLDAARRDWSRIEQLGGVNVNELVADLSGQKSYEEMMWILNNSSESLSQNIQAK